MLVRGAKGNPAVLSVTETNAQSNAKKEKKTKIQRNPPELSVQPQGGSSSCGRGSERSKEKISGLRHWAVRANLTTPEIKAGKGGFQRKCCF